MSRPTLRPRHAATAALLGLTGLLSLTAPASASAAPAVVPVRAAAVTAAGAPTSVPAAHRAPAFVAHAQTHDVVLGNPYPAKDVLAPGWTVVKKADGVMKVGCTGPSVAGRTPNTYTCVPAASYAVACFAKTGHTDVVTCVVDPRAKKLVEYRTTAPLKPTGLPAMAVRRPVAAAMADGTYCRLTSSGVAVREGGTVRSWAACDDRATRLWQKPDNSEQYRIVGGAVEYHAGRAQGALRWADVRARYWIG